MKFGKLLQRSVKLSFEDWTDVSLVRAPCSRSPTAIARFLLNVVSVPFLPEMGKL